LPVTYEVDEAQNAVYAWVSGVVGEDDFLAYVQQFLADTRIRPGYRELVDATSATPGNITAELFDRIAALGRRHPAVLAGSRAAIVVPSGRSYDLARQYQRMAPVEMEVFLNLEAAREWLGLR
jgi:hypothetical protein